MSDVTHWKDYILSNKWVLIAFVFFVLWKFFLIHTLWEDRYIPPVPDDSYIYILHIDSSLRCNNLVSCSEKIISFKTYAGFDHLTYRVFLGSIGKLFHLNAPSAYHINFYIGTILLSLTLVFFLNILSAGNKPLVAFSLFTLALYNGSGSYHGFFWVVPSFFALMIFFLTLAILLDDKNKHWKISLSIIIPLAIYTHILGLYLLAVLPIFLFFYSCFTRKFHPLIFKKILFTSFVAITAYVPVAIYFSNVSYGNPYGPETIVKNIIENNTPEEIPGEIEHSFRGSSLNERYVVSFFPSWKKIKENYFLWIFPNFIGCIIYTACISILFSRKKYELLSLYLAGLLFSLISTINVNGERSLIFLWPMTFLLYGQAGWITLEIVAQKVSDRLYKNFITIFIVIAILFAVFLSALYSYLWNSYLNQTKNIEISDMITEYILSNAQSGEKITYSKNMDFVDSKLILDIGNRKPERTLDPHLAKFYITLEDNQKNSDTLAYKATFGTFFEIIGRTLSFRQKPQDTLFDKENTPSMDLTKKRTFGAVEIYKINQDSLTQ